MSAADVAIAAALSKRGSKYVFGAAGPNTFDCSGLVVWAYAQAGIKLPHFTGSLWATLPHVTKATMGPGDLIFPTPSHVGIYLGNNQMVVAPHTGSWVQVEPVTSIWGIARVTAPGAVAAGGSSTVDVSTGGTQLVGISDANDVLNQLNTIANQLTSPEFWKLIGIGMAGVVFILIGIWQLDKVKSTATNVAKQAVKYVK